MEFTLLGAVIIAMAAMWGSVRWWDREGAISEIAPRPFDALLGAAIAGLVVGRLWAMVATGTNPLTNLGDVILVRAGVDTVGATLGASAMLLWTYRRQFPAALDAVAASALVGLAGWHAGCLVRPGACLGVETSLPWGITDVAGVIRHPVEVYAALAILAGAFLTRSVWQRGPAAGLTAALALTIAALVRLLTEPLRLHLGDGQILVYAVGVAIGLLGMGASVVADRRRVTD